jgi:hypothetical protein
MRILLAALAAFSAWVVHAQAQETETPPYVVFVTIDGYRWQDLFRGADPALVQDERYRERYVDVPDRAAALTPFLLSFREQGALIGNRDEGSCARVSNDFWSSYPGYAEMMAGRPNPRVRYNAAVPNDDITVLERLIRRPELADDVRVFAEWDVMQAILNTERSRIPVFNPPNPRAPHDPQLLEAMQTLLTALPRVTWIAFGDTDNRAHEGDYDAYLAAATEADNFIRALWDSIEANPETAGRTTLIVTTDHGRGDAENNRWTGHGSGRWRGIRVPGLYHEGSEAIFIAARGPGIVAAPQYDMDNCASVSQIAATLLRAFDLLGQEGQPDMAAPLEVFSTAPQ